MQVGDALVRIDHRNGRTLGVLGGDVGLDRFLGGFRQLRQARVQVTDAVVGIKAHFLQCSGVLGQHVLVELLDHDAEHDRVGDLHHRRLQVQREQHALCLRIGHLGVDEAGQCLAAHHRGIDDFAGLHCGLCLEHDGLAVVLHQLDLQAAGVGQRGRLLAAVEITAIHVRDVRLGIAAPRAHAVRVLACIVLHRQRCAAIGVAFAQHRVHRAALDLVVACLDVARDVIGGCVRVVRQDEALVLQFLDRGLQLRHRGRDVRQLDDVGFRLGCQRAQLGQVVADLLPVFQVIRELRQDAAGQRDVTGFDTDTGSGGKGIDDRQQRLGGQERSFVGERVDDLRRIRHGGRNSLADGCVAQGTGGRSGQCGLKLRWQIPPNRSAAVNRQPIVAFSAEPGKTSPYANVGRVPHVQHQRTQDLVLLGCTDQKAQNLFRLQPMPKLHGSCDESPHDARECRKELAGVPGEIPSPPIIGSSCG
ncbi:hypothetical protein D3C81_470450 [compost metagenome]